MLGYASYMNVLFRTYSSTIKWHQPRLSSTIIYTVKPEENGARTMTEKPEKPFRIIFDADNKKRVSFAALARRDISIIGKKMLILEKEGCKLKKPSILHISYTIRV